MRVQQVHVLKSRVDVGDDPGGGGIQGLLKGGKIEGDGDRVSDVGEVGIRVHHEGRVCLGQESEHGLHRRAHIAAECAHRWREGVGREDCKIVRSGDFQFSRELQVDESRVEVGHGGDERTAELRGDC